jgi:hypothetical protein
MSDRVGSGSYRIILIRRIGSIIDTPTLDTVPTIIIFEANNYKFNHITEMIQNTVDSRSKHSMF